MMTKILFELHCIIVCLFCVYSYFFHSYILDVCPDGQTLDPSGECINCTLGTYRKAGVNAICMDCDPNYTTKYTGSVVTEECTVCKYIYLK